MNPALVQAFVVSSMAFTLAFICVGFYRAPGWRHVPASVLIALLSGTFALVNAVFATPGYPADVIELCGRINVALSGCQVAAWLYYERVYTRRRMTDLDRALYAILASAFVVSLIPGAIVKGTMYSTVPSLGVTYHNPVSTPIGDVVMVTLLAVLCVPIVRFFKWARAGNPGGWSHVLGFFAMFALTSADVVSITVGYDALMLADIGLLAPLAGLAVEMSLRIGRDAQALTALNADLAAAASAQAEELAETRDALWRTEQLASLGRLASGVGHEINNPLTFIRANLDLLREVMPEGEDREETTELIDEMQEGTDRIARIVEDLRVFARPPLEGVHAKTSVVSAVRATTRMLSSQVASNVALTVDVPEQLHTALDERRFGQVLMAVLDNAVQATRGVSGPSVDIRARVGQEGQIKLTVEDNGAGMSAETRERAFEPFFTTKDVGAGTGLGLYVANSLLQNGGGEIELFSRPGQGTRVVIWLPPAKRWRVG